ncbi:MAG: hypothetical protein MH204_08665 [Fimbriimonadaceae bacterium]|nr:hypothetical protein [Fimbriimonadaceae bacterium]
MTAPDRRVLGVALSVTLLAAVPFLAGLAGEGVSLQQQMAVDDQMVYAAWVEQARSGRFLFENLFATQTQPGLTIHLYFLLLGWVSHVTGVLGALTLGRLVFTFLFVVLLARFLRRVGVEEEHLLPGLVGTIFCGGLGVWAWEDFGRLILGASPVGVLTGGRLPIDVWQPEAFVFPSMLTNGLFMASLCLILVILQAILDAQEGWGPVGLGAGAFLVLMNIHAYDVLLLALVLVGLIAGSLAVGRITGGWMGRGLAIGAGVLPAAGWFVFVYLNDPVFQSRAATLTYSPGFREVLEGLGPAVLAALVGAHLSAPVDRPLQRWGGPLCAAAALAIPAVLSIGFDAERFLMGWPLWLLCLGLAIGAVSMMQIEDDGRRLLWSWALVGSVAIYFPALFQRKLAMGLMLPWAILAFLALWPWIMSLAVDRRRLAGLATAALAFGTSIFWLRRELSFVRQNVSSTTVNPVKIDEGAALLLERMRRLPGRVIAVAMPGVPLPDQSRPGSFFSPYLPDLNPMIAGLGGKTAFAGHWSETPEYEARRAEATTLFLRGVVPEGVTHVLAPNPEDFPELPLVDLRGSMTPLAESGRWILLQAPTPPSSPPE